MTLVELLVGVAVVGVLLAVAAPSFSALMERRRVAAAAAEVASMFTFAKAEANVITEKLNLHMEPVPDSVGAFSCMRLSTAADVDLCGCDIPRDQVCSIGKGKLLREFVLQRDTSVSFGASGVWKPAFPYIVSYLHGSYITDVKDVQVTVTGAKTGAQLRIEYNSTGRVRMCSPQGSMSGYPVCS